MSWRTTKHQPFPFSIWHFMSIHSHHFPLNSNTSSFMHIHFKFLPTSHQPNWPSMKIIEGYLIAVTQEPAIGSFAPSTQEQMVRKESFLLPHKNQQWEEINQLLEGCSFQLWDFFLCMWELQILYGCKLRKWCMRECFAFSLKGSPVIICSKFMYIFM